MRREMRGERTEDRGEETREETTVDVFTIHQPVKVSACAQMKRAVSSRGGHVCDARCQEGGVTGVIDDACRGGDECAHVGGDAYRGSFCEWNRCALLLWRRQMWLLPASAPVMA